MTKRKDFKRYKSYAKYKRHLNHHPAATTRCNNGIETMAERRERALAAWEAKPWYEKMLLYAGAVLGVTGEIARDMARHGHTHHHRHTHHHH